MEILNKIPRHILVIIVLGAGALLIFLGDPPKDICDTQVDVFFQSQKGNMTSLKGAVSGFWKRSAKYCSEAKTLGGCAEFHSSVKNILRDIDITSYECIPRLLEQEGLLSTLQNSMSLMVKLAWGEAPPELGPSVYGWMSMQELGIYCRLKLYLERALGEEKWEVFARGVIKKLPQSDQLSFQESFDRSLFSVRCEAVLNP